MRKLILIPLLLLLVLPSGALAKDKRISATRLTDVLNSAEQKQFIETRFQTHFQQHSCDIKSQSCSDQDFRVDLAYRPNLQGHVTRNIDGQTLDLIAPGNGSAYVRANANQSLYRPDCFTLSGMEENDVLGLLDPSSGGMGNIFSSVRVSFALTGEKGTSSRSTISVSQAQRQTIYTWKLTSSASRYNSRGDYHGKLVLDKLGRPLGMSTYTHEVQVGQLKAQGPPFNYTNAQSEQWSYPKSAPDTTLAVGLCD
jgi:hypothetical protein